MLGVFGIAATVAELVDAQDLGSCGATRGGSSPSGRIPRAFAWRLSTRGTPSAPACWAQRSWPDRKSTRLNSSHSQISYAVFCLKKKNINVMIHILDHQDYTYRRLLH